jgi:hypothetical protein
LKKIKLIFTAILLFVSIAFVKAQNVKAFYVGHSLSDNIADMVHSLSVADGAVIFNNWIYQSVPGASLEYQWSLKPNGYSSIAPAFYGFYDTVHGLPNGTFNKMVLTESVPRHAGTAWGIPVTYQYADSFYNYAITNNPGIKVYLYEVWHCLNSGTPTGCAWDINSNPWRARLDDDLPMWESVVDTLNARYNPAQPVCLIPAGQGLARLYDSIAAGVVPGITAITDLFSDDIHLTDQGRYFIACIHFAMMHNKSPVGLTHQLTNMWGSLYNAPTAAQALKFQQIAWQTVLGYPGTCLSSLPLSLPSDTVKESIVAQELQGKTVLKPNPVGNTLFVVGMSNHEAFQIFDAVGKSILEGKGNAINTSNLPNGYYVLKIKNAFYKFIKQ